MPKTKEELISWLINDDIDTIVDGREISYLSNLLLDGFIGYRKQSLKSLRQEYSERTA